MTEGSPFPKFKEGPTSDVLTRALTTDKRRLTFTVTKVQHVQSFHSCLVDCVLEEIQMGEIRQLLVK